MQKYLYTKSFLFFYRIKFVLIILITSFTLPAYAQEKLWDELNNKFNMLYQQEQILEAGKVAKEAMKIAEEDFGSEHPNVAISLNNLALICQSQGKYAEAESLFKSALAIIEKTLSPDVAALLSNLAYFYQSQRKYAKAEPLLRRELAIVVKTYGLYHPNVIIPLKNLAFGYAAQDNYTKAEKLYKRVLTIVEKVFGVNHLEMGKFLNELADFYLLNFKYAEAEHIYKRSLDIMGKTLSQEHPDVVNVLEDLKEIYKYTTIENIEEKDILGKHKQVDLSSLCKELSVLEVHDISFIKMHSKKDCGFNGYSIINHDYEVKNIDGNNVVVDHATGLMYHQSGSPEYMTWQDAKQWVRDLNKMGYAGSHDWRLPTVEEGVSLLESNKKNGALYIGQVFSQRQNRIWTVNMLGKLKAWSINFFDGNVYNYSTKDKHFVRPVRNIDTNYPKLITQHKFEESQTEVVYSNDGRFYYTGGDDGVGRLWEAESGLQIRQFKGHKGMVCAASFSPDGHYILTGSFDKTARLWDVYTGKELHTFGENESYVNNVAFSKDGNYILTSAGLTRLWETSSGKELRRFFGDCIGFFSDNQSVVTYSSEGIHIWETFTGNELRRFKVDFIRNSEDKYSVFSNVIYSAVLSPNDRYIIIGKGDNTAQLIDAYTGEKLRQFMGHTSGVISVAFSNDGRNVLTIGNDGFVKLWDTETTKELKSFSSKGYGPILSASLSPDNRYILSGGKAEESFYRWDVKEEKCLKKLQWLTSPSYDVAISHNGLYYLTGNDDKSARLWDTKAGNEVQQFIGHTGGIASVAFSKDDKKILTGSFDTTAKLWDIDSGEELQTFRGHTSKVNSVMFSHDGSFILTGGWDKTARTWDAKTGIELHKFEHFDVVTSVSLSPDDSIVLTGSMDGTIRIWDRIDGETIDNFRAPNRKEIDTDAGELLIDLVNNVYKFPENDIETVKNKIKPTYNPIYSVAFSPDGNSVLTGEQSGIARLWDIEAGKQVRIYTGDMDVVFSVAFSPDGQMVFCGGINSATNDSSAIIFETTTGRVVQRFVGHTDCTKGSFSGDGKYILTCGLDNTTRLWDINTGDELCKLFCLYDKGWTVVDPEGRFDTSDPEGLHALHWIFPDDPLKLLSPEIFMRDYFTPMLLTGILTNKKFKPIPHLGKLNRLQPIVEIIDVVEK